MNNRPRQPRESLNKAFLKVKVSRSDIEQFKANFLHLLDHINENESEEFHKNLMADFLKNTYYSSNYFINTKERNDLVIHNQKDSKSSVGIILEVKKPKNKAEMANKDNLNAKALQELILYFLRERITHKNLEIKYLIITNIYEWFIFDAQTFEKYFFEDKQLIKRFEDFEAGRLIGKTTDFFYKEIAKPAIEAIKHELGFTYFDIRDYERFVRDNNPEDDEKLIALFKLLSPQHLLKLPTANDSNTLDKEFYSELLYIIGLTETKEKNKKLIQRQPQNKQNSGSLIENAISQLDSLDKLSRLENPEQFGETEPEQLFNIALELSITWMNRILFLKLLESQLMTYHKGERNFAFLNLDKIQNFCDLDRLFFQVLAVKPKERKPDLKEVFAHIPYLNSSLFEPTELEHQSIVISNLREEKLPIFSLTILKDANGKKRTGELNTLHYLFEFLDAYDFSSEGSEGIQDEQKTLINASVLGLIFEKINGYKDGSYFTPGFITMYMCRETLRKAVVQKFNEIKGWNCQTLDDLYDKIEDRTEANQIINRLKICDPAVGSGHFLVSALNELIAIKHDLKILQDQDGRRLKEYQITVENDELVITDEDNQPFTYTPQNQESQRIQETLFHEKQRIIENCLFGVDINPNSVKICRLRLWIELLKNAYYKADTNYTELETLPNIDINIKCGNSLMSRFPLDADLKPALKKNKIDIETYQNAVKTYRHAENKQQKREMEKLMNTIKGNFKTTLQGIDPKKTKLRQLEGELDVLENQLLLFEETKAEQKARDKKIAQLNNEIDQLKIEIEEIESGKIYENAFEWRFEFPEVLDDTGKFMGFDVVLGNPPYGVNFSIKEKNFLKVHYSDVHVRTPESFNYFLYRIKNITCLKGISSIIIPSSILNQIEFEKTRELILKNCSLFININLGDSVFEDVATPTCILGWLKIDDFTKSLHDSMLYSDLSKFERNKLPLLLNKVDNLVYKSQIISNLSYSFIYKNFQTLIDKCYVGHPTLGNVAEDIATGISPGLADAFIIQSDEVERKGLEKDKIKKLIIGGEINCYFLQPKSQKNIIYFSSEIDINQYPSIINHLKSYQEKLENRAETKRGIIPYYVMLRPRREKLFIKPKILIRQTANRIIAAYDEDHWYCLKSAIIVQLSNQSTISYYYLLGILNSKLMDFLYKDLVKEEARIFPEVKPIQLSKLPIAIGTSTQQSWLEKIVNKIVTAKKTNFNTDTTRLEQQINQMVYELYGLTEEEIKIVEGITD